MKCAICGGKQVQEVGTVMDWFLRTSKLAFPMSRCNKCGSYYLSSRLGNRVLRAAYKAGYWWEGGSSVLGGLMEGYRRLGAMDISGWIEKSSRESFRFKRSLKVAELGCGVGTTLAVGREKYGWEVAGFDSSYQASEVARRVYGVRVGVREIESNLPELRTFDVVILSHVLEHLRRPDKLFRLLRLLMKKEARLVVMVPNAGSLGVKVFGLRWRGFDAPRHLRTYSKRGLLGQLKQAGFTVIHEKRFSFRDDAAHLVGSLFPNWDPIAVNVKSDKSNINIKSLMFGLLTAVVQPVALVSGWCGWGETINLIVRKEQ